jgi:DNA-binding HxlR family transcriptional regulator
MKGYGQFCPIAKASEIFCQRWTSLILRDLSMGASRFSELKKGVPLASPTLLSQRLKQLEAEGVIERRKSESGKSWTYHLTEAGRDFIPLIEALGVWGQRWSRRELRPDEVDLDLFVWALENSVDPEAFGEGPSLVELEFRNQPKHKARWWFLNEKGRCQLCIDNPGHEVNLYVSAVLETMIYIWRGDTNLREALESGALEVQGESQAMKAFPLWLRPSGLAHVESRRGGSPSA